MLDAKIEQFSLVPYRRLPYGAFFVDPNVHQVDISKLDSLMKRASAFSFCYSHEGLLIKVRGSLAFRGGNRGEGFRFCDPSAEMIYSSTLAPKPTGQKDQFTIRVLGKIMELEPKGIPLAELTRTFSSVDARTLRDTLGSLEKQCLVYRIRTLYALTGEGVRECFREGFCSSGLF